MLNSLPKSNGSKSVESKATDQLSRFAREEDGVVTAMALFFVLMMCLVGGIGVDLMRNEMERTQVQGTLDRAVLAASDMNQQLPPRSVVHDYFEKAGLTEFLDDSNITVTDNPNLRRVSATARGTTKNMFMSVMGRATLPVYARSTAAQGVSNIEVSLVLDISGSMAGRKNREMRRAACEFVDIVLEPSQAETVTLSLVPYNGKVNAGSLVADYFDFTTQHTSHNCVGFSDGQFNMAGLVNGDLPERLAHFDRNSDANTDTLRRPHCQTNEYGAILPWSNNAEELKDHIDTLGAGGWTAIDLGMKWATVLLDPSSQDELSDMATDGHVNGKFIGRPSNYYDSSRPTEDLTMKVVVLMTDGANTNQYDLREEFKTGASDIYAATDIDGTRFPDQNLYSVYDAGLDQFYWLEEKTWNPLPKGADTAIDVMDVSKVTRKTNVQVFGTWPVAYIAEEFYNDDEYRAVAGYSRYEEIRNAAYRTAAKDEGIIVFSVAFEAPDGGKAALQNCASTAGHYFDVKGKDLSEAFASIARQISQLKLTQ